MLPETEPQITGLADQSKSQARRALQALVTPLLFLACCLAIFAEIYALAPWWDEGWTISVAQTWVETGFYGLMQGGALRPHGLEASFPNVMLVALSFKLLGVGVWQARLVGIVLTIASLALFYYLTARLYNRRAALMALVILTLCPYQLLLNPFTAGAQVLAEPLMICALLAGYSCLLLALRRPAWIVGALLCWGIALLSKAQAVPFLFTSLVATLLVALFIRRWRIAGLIAIGLIGAWGTSRLLLWAWPILMGERLIEAAPLTGMYAVTAIVFERSARNLAALMVFLYGLPVTLGLCIAAWPLLRKLWARSFEDRDFVVLGLFTLVASWGAWFLLLSAGWPRYYYPIYFIGALFAGYPFYTLTEGFSIRRLAMSFGAMIRARRINIVAMGRLLIFGFLAFSIMQTLLTLTTVASRRADVASRSVADYINQQTPPGARVETYESELYHMLERPYYYPPDQVHVELNRRYFLSDRSVVIDYDPLAADPDYLIIGGMGKMWKLYEPLVDSGVFRPVISFKHYDIYERVR